MKKKRIYVQGHEWTVLFMEGPLVTDGDVVFGDANHYTQTIRVMVSDVSESVIRTTLLHEIIHAIFRTVGNVSAGGHSEESIVTTMEVGLFEFFSDKRNDWALDMIRNR